MPDLNPQHEAALKAILADVDALRARVGALHAETQYEDLEHADLGLQIVRHAAEEVLEHKGLGGAIAHTPDAAAYRQATDWLGYVRRVHVEASRLLATHPNEDLETAITALTVATGSLEEVAERYE